MIAIEEISDQKVVGLVSDDNSRHRDRRRLRSPRSHRVDIYDTMRTIAIGASAPIVFTLYIMTRKPFTHKKEEKGYEKDIKSNRHSVIFNNMYWCGLDYRNSP